MSPGPVSQFITRHFRHFNAATVVDAAEAYRDHLDGGGTMLLAMAGAMSTAELGLSLAEMIRRRQGPRHLLHRRQPRGGRVQPRGPRPLRAHPRLPGPHALPTKPSCLRRQLNRVTDTCIPEEEAMRRLEEVVLDEWQAADARVSAGFPTSSCIA